MTCFIIQAGTWVVTLIVGSAFYIPSFILYSYRNFKGLFGAVLTSILFITCYVSPQYLPINKGLSKMRLMNYQGERHLFNQAGCEDLLANGVNVNYVGKKTLFN